MDVELLKILGQVAGIGGISLGVLLLVFRDVVRKQIFPTLTKEQAYRLLRLVLLLVWLVALLGIGAWVWVSTHSTNGTTTSVRALAFHERTSNLRDLLATGSEVATTSPPATFGGEHVVRHPAPSAFAVQQVLSLAQTDRKSVVQALVPLLSDQNVTVSSAAVLAIAGVIANAESERGQLLLVLPRAETLALQNEQRLNLRGASLVGHDLTTLAGTALFYGAEMRAADMSRCKLDGITFKTANLACTSFVQASLAGTTFDMANLEDAVFWGASAPNATFVMAHLRRTDFSRHTTPDLPRSAVFPTSSSYVPANLEGANFGHSQLYGANMSEARIGGARFHGASVSDVNFHGAFLMGMDQGVTEAYIRESRPALLTGCIFK